MRLEYSQPITSSNHLPHQVPPCGQCRRAHPHHDVASHQLLVPNLGRLAWSDTLACLNLENSTDAKGIVFMRPVVLFHRMNDSKAKEAYEVVMILPVWGKVRLSSVEMGTLLMLIFARWRHTKHLRLSQSRV